MMKLNNKQHGGMILGVIVGVLVGLGVALGVAIYVMKVPTPFNNKGTTRSATQDAAETKKNKDWDPNAALSGKPAVKPDATNPAPAPASVAPAATPAPAPAPSPQAAPTKPAQPAAAPTAAVTSGDIEYFVQVAAFGSEAEAQAMRGKLALAGFEGKVIERDQSGRTVYRVRTGPYIQAAGDKAKASLEAAGFETMIVRSQK